MPRESGTVKFFNTQKGYGFILGSGAGGQGQIEYFVHFSAIKSEGFKSLAAGEAVEFDLENNPLTGKQCAVNVTGPGGSAVQGSPQDMKGSGKGKGGQAGLPGGQYQNDGGKQFGGKGGKKGGKGGGKGQGKKGGSYNGSYSGGFSDGFGGGGFGGAGGGFGGEFGGGCYTGFMPMGFNPSGFNPSMMPYPYAGGCGMQFPSGMMG